MAWVWDNPNQARPVVASDSIHMSYNLGVELGSGTYGRVLRATRKRDNKGFAVKEIPKFQVRNLQDVRNEVAVMKKLRHPNILKIVDSFDSSRYLHIVIELCTGGELYEAICKRGHLDETNVIGILRQTFAGIRHCHAANVVHRDLKPQNLLFLNPVPEGQNIGSCQLKIVDFGVSKIFRENEVLRQVIGSPSYMAPEVFQGRYSPKCDIWSMGVILYQMLSGRKPFANRMDAQLNAPDFSSSVWRGASNNCIDFIQLLLRKDARQRPSAAEALSHPWLKVADLPFSKKQPITQETDTSTSQFQVSAEALQALTSFNNERRLQRELVSFLSSQSAPVANNRILHEQFRALDLDGNGFITPSELRTVLAREPPADVAAEVGVNQRLLVYEQQQQLARQIQDIIRAADVSGDCKISYHEFLAAAMLRSMHLHEDQIARITSDVILTQQGLVSSRAATQRDASPVVPRYQRDASPVVPRYQRTPAPRHDTSQRDQQFGVNSPTRSAEPIAAATPSRQESAVPHNVTHGERRVGWEQQPVAGATPHLHNRESERWWY